MNTSAKDTSRKKFKLDNIVILWYVFSPILPRFTHELHVHADTLSQYPLLTYF